MVQPPKDLGKFESLLQIVQALRGPEGCPWDKEQTHRTLTPFAIEEAFELAEAIENDDVDETILELGDLLLQVVLHAEIGRGEGRFEISDVVRGISEKMVRRHPHVFLPLDDADAQKSQGVSEVKSSAEVLSNWAKIKDAEKLAKAERLKDAKPNSDSLTGERFDIAVALPALVRSQKIGEKTKRFRFDWSEPHEVLAKVHEEFLEVSEELSNAGTPDALEHEIGDLLFSVAQLARHLNLDAEQCLRSANTRFETRFFAMRAKIAAAGKEYDRLSLAELEEAWQAIKKTLSK